MRNVLYLPHATPDVYAIIAAEVPAGYRLLTLDADDDAERAAKLADAEVVIVATPRLTAAMIDAAPRLALVHHQGVGWQDTVDRAALLRRGIPLALTPEGTTTGVAEHTILMMLAACKLLPYADREMRDGRFHVYALRPRSREIAGMTIGYLGFGRIGQAVAARLVPFGCRGLYPDPDGAIDAAAAQALGCRAAAFEDVLASADILSLHLPLTPATRGLVGAAALARLKPGAIVVNTARGGIVDEDALADALADGRLAAAALDVFAQEPPDPGHRLFAYPNVVLTPHISAGTRDALATKMRALFANVERYFRGEPLHNLVAR